MSEYVPTTASIRSDYIRGTAADFIATEGRRCPCGEAHGVKSETARVNLVWDTETRAVAGPEFDRWLAGVVREAKAEALREAADELRKVDDEMDAAYWTGEGYELVDDWLLDRADQIERTDDE